MSSGQIDRAAVAGDQADLVDVAVADARFRRDDGDVAEQRDRRRQADDVAVDGADDRLVELEQAVDEAPADHRIVDLAFFEDVAARALRHRLDVAADAEDRRRRR